MLQAYARHISAVMGKSTTTSTDELLQYGRRAFNAEVARHEADRRRSELETRRLSAEAKRQAEREAAAASEGAAEEPAAHGADAPGVDSSDPPQAGEQVPARPFPGGAAARPPRFAPDAVPATEPSEPEPVADPQEPS